MTQTKQCRRCGRVLPLTEYGINRAKSNGKFRQRLEIGEKNISNTITSVQKDCMVIEMYNN